MVKCNCIPNKKDVKVIKASKKMSLTRRRWLNTFSKDHFYFDNHIKKFKDQKTRAIILLDKLLLYKKRKICIMDGHGRFLYQILYLTNNVEKYKILKNIKIFVCEIDSESHKFHKHIYPNNVCAVKMDIFEFANMYNDKDCIFYYNFCSFGKNYNYITENLIREMNKNHLLMITFHVRRGKHLYKFADLLNNISSDKTCRSNTFSWFIPRQNNKYIKLLDYID
jgi:hypothetical protein